MFVWSALPPVVYAFGARIYAYEPGVRVVRGAARREAGERALLLDVASGIGVPQAEDGGVMADVVGAAHPPEVRARALELARLEGARSAAHRLGLSVNTVSSWVQRERRRECRQLARVDVVVPELVDGDGERLAWPELRQRLSAVLGESFGEALVAMRSAVAAGRHAEARSLATVVGVLTDKLAALGKDSGGKGSSNDALRDEVRRLAEQLGSDDGE